MRRGPPALVISLGVVFRRVYWGVVYARQRWLISLAGGQVRLPGDEPIVALTFDDGPDPTWTARVLEVLDRHDVKATFFVTGEGALRSPDTVLRVRAAGHSIGFHGHHHENMSRIRRRAALREIDDGRASVTAVLGEPLTLYRPPQGGLTLSTALAIRRKGLRMIMWSRESEDWRPGVELATVLDQLAGTTPGDVVLMHDTIANPYDPRQLDRSVTVAALERMLPELKSRGLDFVTV